MRTIWLRIAAAIRDVSAENLALILALGLVLGAFPLYGCPTILCALASQVLRVNFPALQLVNQLSWPLQIAMLVPLTRLGSRIIAPPTGFATTAAGRLVATAMQAVAGWFCVCIPLGFLLYITLTYLLRRNGRQWCSNAKISPLSSALAPHPRLRAERPLLPALQVPGVGRRSFYGKSYLLILQKQNSFNLPSAS